ncbi:hypothetical protein LCGC14_1125950 [marine sediment metagenome]|uniref:Uncharacterized protein n=2 Tax=root TaxID=1 RepID=A0A831QJX0_9FLAO|nr:hypothetical protein [Methylophaga sp.]HEA19640.1 hypothetical protein [Pricia antarctica]
MIIKLWQKTHKQIQKDVSFPIYRQISSDYDTEYTRINDDLTAISITEELCPTGRVKYIIEYVPKYTFDKSDMNYHLGLNENSSSKEEFFDAFYRFEKHIKKIGATL